MTQWADILAIKQADSLATVKQAVFMCALLLEKQEATVSESWLHTVYCYPSIAMVDSKKNKHKSDCTDLLLYYSCKYR
ncbi:hypothetical protein [Enterococcus songbeiensis]|uniref:hypothetical protein n=1 Tax=Enterococcus songbeiensis TaxID=2559927 RepID=UPI0010F66C6D|nr:hypothetical protein [Enterococcus songbeiensis]